MDLKFVEMLPASKVIVEENLKIKPGENVLFLVDTRVYEYMGTEPFVQSLVASTASVGGEPVVMTMIPREKAGDILPKTVEAAMNAADVVFPITTPGITTSPSFLKAFMNGKTRMIVCPCGEEIGKNNDMLFRLMPKTIEEARELADLTTELSLKFKGNHNIRMTSQNGTDLIFKVGDYRMIFGTGMSDQPGLHGCFPAGDSVLGINYGSAEGKLVIDGSITPIHRALNEPIELIISKGYIVDIQGGSDAAYIKETMINMKNPEVYNIAEFGFGTNPKAKLVGEPVEDEHILGATHIGIGSNIGFGGNIEASNWHIDGIILKATVEIDGEIILQDGKFII